MKPKETLAAWKPDKRLPKPLGKLGGDPASRGRALLLVSSEPPEKRAAARALTEALKAAPKDPQLWYLLGRAETSDSNRARIAPTS